MIKKRVSRREFLRSSAGGSAAIAALATEFAPAKDEATPADAVDRHAIVGALGDTLIPIDAGDPGYRSLEKYKITEEVMKGLAGIPDSDFDAFIKGCGQFFNGRSFLQLTESQRADYLRLVIDG